MSTSAVRPCHKCGAPIIMAFGVTRRQTVALDAEPSRLGTFRLDPDPRGDRGDFEMILCNPGAYPQLHALHAPNCIGAEGDGT